MKIQLIQLEAGPDKEENLRKVLEYIRQTDAELVVFPEYLMGVNSEKLSKEYIHRLAEPLNGNFVSSIKDASREKSVSVVFSAYLKERDKVYNTSILIEKGTVRGVYKKIHLFDAFGFNESSIFSPGDSLVVYRLGDFTVGLAVCFDIRFPEIFRAMAKRGTDLFIVPAAWYKGPYKVEQWKAILTSRAHENTSFIVAVNQTGKYFVGHSLVATPFGHILVDLGEGERSLTVTLEPSEVEEARKTIPVLQLSKWDFYRRLYEED